MKPLVYTDFSQLSPSSLTPLEDCSEESVYAPGFIQSHGLLFTLQEPELRILQASANVQQFLDTSAEALLGQPLQRVFSRVQVQHLISALKQQQLDGCNPFELTLRRGLARADRQPSIHQFRGTLHQTQNMLILELEPLLKKDTQILQTYHHLQQVISKLRSASSLSTLAQNLAQSIKSVTGFDRVMIYRFEADDHGSVIAEEKDDHLESYLGLHYPATDIPAPSRQLFYRNWVRHIPDVNAVPAALRPARHSVTDQALDLSACVLRGVSPCHIEYLQNMGVSASLTISLIDDKRLWGLIACHHYSPRLISYETRRTCELIGQFASVELVRQQERELDDYRLQIQVLQDRLQQAFLRDPNFIQPVLTQNASELLNLVHAEGVAIALEQDITLIGQTPPLTSVQPLLSWLSQQHPQEIYVTDCLCQPYPPAQEFYGVASGILAISIVLHQKSYHLVWFRPEQIRTVTWAGSAQAGITVDDHGHLHLCPRKSFQQWKEIVQRTSVAWQPVEIEAAMIMRNTLMLAVLEFSQAALEAAAERAMIANQAKSQFLAKMSHELRTPLNAILGFTQVMNRNTHTPVEFQEHLGIISRSGEHLLDLINGVLEMSRIEAGQLVLTQGNFNLYRLLQGIYDLFVLKAAQKGLTLTFEKASGLPRYVCSDEGKVRQILINLISNAIKFTVHGGVTLRIWTDGQAANQTGCHCYPTATPPCQPSTLFFAVADTGLGIEASDWESVFEAFMQTKQGRYLEGTGLGLSISRQFARLMGGDITVQSNLNQGSTFTCHIVVHQATMMDPTEAETDRIVTGLESGQPTYRILVAEDVPENRQLLTALLEPIGFEVLTVDNGIDAIAQWQAWHPHLILMDIEMPGMNGYEATQYIRAQQTAVQLGSLPPTQIIALTAYAFETDRTACLDAGCDGYLAKPLTETALFETLASHLGVRYQYGQAALHADALVERRALTLEDLQVMPAEWRAQVYEAALDLNDARVRQLIAEISDQYRFLREGMQILVDSFQLEAIAALVQPAAERL